MGPEKETKVGILTESLKRAFSRLAELGSGRRRLILCLSPPSELAEGGGSVKKLPCIGSSSLEWRRGGGLGLGSRGLTLPTTTPLGIGGRLDGTPACEVGGPPGAPGGICCICTVRDDGGLKDAGRDWRREPASGDES